MGLETRNAIKNWNSLKCFVWMNLKIFLLLLWFAKGIIEKPLTSVSVEWSWTFLSLDEMDRLLGTMKLILTKGLLEEKKKKGNIFQKF